MNSKKIEALEKKLAEARKAQKEEEERQEKIAEKVVDIFGELLAIYMQAEKENKIIIRNVCKYIARSCSDLVTEKIGSENFENLFKDFNATAKVLKDVAVVKENDESEVNDDE